ncbi:RNA polymerase sigma factor [Chloroflexota bacterium]
MKFARHKVREEIKAKAAATKAACDRHRIDGLVREAAGGNFEAFGEIYSIYLDRIYRYIFYQIKDEMAAQDLTQEVFIKAWKAMSSIRGEGKTFQSWLYRIARNHLIDYLRGTKKSSSLDRENLPEISDPKPEVGTELERRELLKTIDCLPDNQKQVIILKFLEGQNNQEIAGIMGKREGAIRVLQMRALANLRQKLNEENDRNGKQTG